MCGICLAISKKNEPVSAIVEMLYKNQKSRGSEGFGYLTMDENKEARIIRAVDEWGILRNLRADESTAIMFHHRWPTSTDNVLNACHPFIVKGIKTGKLYGVIHNGIIWNDGDLKEMHEKIGVKYNSIQVDGRYNDSEALATELMLVFEGKRRYSNFKANGSIAFIAVEMDENGVPLKYHYSRNSGSPLMLFESKNTIQLSSELRGGKEIDEGILYSVDLATRKTSEREFKMKTYEYTYEPYTYGSYGGEYYDADSGEFYNNIPDYNRVANKKLFNDIDYKSGFSDGYWNADEIMVDLNDARIFQYDSDIAYEKTGDRVYLQESKYWIGYCDGLHWLQMEDEFIEESIIKEAKKGDVLC